MTIEIPEPPEGWELVEHRRPQHGERIIAYDGSAQFASHGARTCRWIIRKKAEPPPAKTIADEIREVYGKPFEELKPPEGYAFIGPTEGGFRKPLGTEKFMSRLSMDVTEGVLYLCRGLNPKRLILRNLKRIVFEESEHGSFVELIDGRMNIRNLRESEVPRYRRLEEETGERGHCAWTGVK